MKTKFLSKEEFLTTPEAFQNTRVFIQTKNPEEDFAEVSSKIRSLPKSLSQFWITFMSGCTMYTSESDLKECQRVWNVPEDMQVVVVFDEGFAPSEVRAWKESLENFAKPDWQKTL